LSVDICQAGMLTRKIIVILFDGGLPYVQCIKNRLTCENYIAKIIKKIPEASTKFQEISGVSMRNLKFHEIFRSSRHLDRQ